MEGLKKRTYYLSYDVSCISNKKNGNLLKLARLDNSMGAITLKEKLTRYLHDFHNIENLIFNVIPSL